MSVKVAVACEDPIWDQYILKPIIKAALKAAGKPAARIQIVTDPRCTGFSTLTARACEILEVYGKVADIVVFACDVDCEDGKGKAKDKLARLKTAIKACKGDATVVLVGARHELEVWALWGVREQLGVSWSKVLEECDPKERYFDGVLTNGDRLVPDGGRKRLVKESLASGWRSIAEGCEELAVLRLDLETALA